jgi:LacI family transcriptional regulator
MSSRVTIRTLAEELGVNQSTVSRALDPRRSDTISAELVVRIREHARARGFDPDPWARSLRTRRTRTLGLLIPRLTDPVLAAMFEAAEDRAREHGYQAVTVSTGDRPDGQARLIEVLLERRVDGLILATALRDDPMLTRMAEGGVRFVLLNRASGDWAAVRGDDELGGYLATRHLLVQGHRRIGMVAGPSEVSTAGYRLDGYRRAHAELGVPVDDTLVVASKFTAQDGVEAGTSLLTRRERPTAVFAVNDTTAIGLMSVARDLGLRVPDDVAVVGYNDTELAPLLPVPLTSVSLPVREMGREAVDRLVSVLDGDGTRVPTSRVYVPRLVVRSSSVHERSPIRA